MREDYIGLSKENDEKARRKELDSLHISVSAHLVGASFDLNVPYSERNYWESVGENGFPYINIEVEDVEGSRNAAFVRVMLLPAIDGAPYVDFLETLDMYSQEVWNFAEEMVHSDAFNKLYVNDDGVLRQFYDEDHYHTLWCGYIERLYVEEDYRSCGIASYLIDNLANIIDINLGPQFAFRVAGLMPCPCSPYMQGEEYHGIGSSFSKCDWVRETNEEMKRWMIEFAERKGFVKNSQDSESLFKLLYKEK